MAVLGRLLVSSAERLDLPDLLSLDSYAAGDWKYFLRGIVGNDKPYILKGFDVIDPLSAIGTQSCSIRVADSVTFYPGSNSGSFFHGLEEGNPNSAPLVPELRKNAVNYVYLTFSTFNTSVDTRAFWDPDKDGVAGGEFTQDINTESVLKVDVNVSTGSFPANTIPVAKITVGPVVITAIEDARDLMFRLGSGGINPNPFNTYGWRSLPSGSYARQEPPTQMLAGGVNPFQGADKNILTLKEWMDAIMSKLRELGGTTYWYDDTSSFSIITNFYDAVATAFKSKGKWVHDTVTPGLLTWTEDIQIKMTSDPRTYIIRQGSKNLADEQVMWIDKERNLLFNPTDENVQWVNGQPYINTIGGAVGLFANLSKGDYVKKANDTIDKWVRVEEFYDAVNLGGSTTTPAGARSVRLGSAYLGNTGAEKGRYDKGVYLPADVQVTDRDTAAIGLAGGQFHWLAVRSDTIESIGNAVTTSLSVAIDQHDGTTARVTSVGHGLSDGDRVTITNTINFDGTYQVEVETADVFYINISGGPFADEAGDAYYAVITTVARVTPYGFQEESSNHGFGSGETISIDGTVDYNGEHIINVRSNTEFQIAMPGPAGTESAGTATLARIIVRNEGGSAEVVQGQIIDIGGSAADNIRQYIGMQSLAETSPTYNIPPSYNTLDGMANYNGVINENLTVRLAKVTAMMADKAQDKTIKFLPSSGITSITNTQNGSAQELRFLPDGASLTIVTPSSDGQAFLALPDTANPLSLLENQAAYVQIDRNNPSIVTMTVAPIVNVPLEENTFVIAVRINTPDIYIWEGSIITEGSQPPPAYLSTIVRQNQMLKLVEGGTWSWDLGTETLAWNADAFAQVPGLANSANSIAAGSVVLAAGEVAYVDINRVGPGGALTVGVADNATMPLVTDRFILARRETTDVIVGFHSMRLIDGESKKLYASLSDQTITYLGVADAADDAPVYGSNNYVTDGDSLTASIGVLDANLGSISGSIRWKEPVADFAALPVVGNLDGDVRLTLDSRIAYSWITATSQWKPMGGSSSGGIKVVGGGTLSNSQAATSTVAYSLDVVNNTGSTPNATQYFAGPRFTPSVSGLFTDFDISVSGPLFPPQTANFWIELWALSGGLPVGGPLATSNVVDVMTLPNNSPTWDRNPALTTFTFPSPYYVMAGVQYALVGRSDAVSTDTCYINNLNVVTADEGYVATTDGGATWFEIERDTDLVIRVQTALAPQLNFTADMYLEVAGLSYADNTIQTANSPIVFPNDQDVAYVTPNTDAGGPSLVVSVGPLTGVAKNDVIIARREGTDLIVGSSSMRLVFGESKTLYTGVSDQLLSVLPAADSADNTGIARILASPSPSTRVLITGASKTVPDGTVYSLQLKNLLMDFEGAQIDFATGSVYAADGVTPLGINFTPASIASGQYRWYSVTLVPGTVTGDNRITGQLAISPGSADGASADAAPRATFASTGIKLGQVVVQEDGGSIASIPQSSVVQMATGGGSGSEDEDPVRVTLNNSNTVTAIAGLQFDPAEYCGFIVSYQVTRTRLGAGIAHSGIGTLKGTYDPVSGTYALIEDYGGDTSVIFSIDATGQIFYQAFTMFGGGYNGLLQYKIINAFKAV